MRKIKFKGKSIEDGKWKYGDLSHVGEQTVVKNNPVSDGRPVFTFSFDPSTVCLFYKSDAADQDQSVCL